MSKTLRNIPAREHDYNPGKQRKDRMARQAEIRRRRREAIPVEEPPELHQSFSV
jgi:hypothetical protein